MAAGKEQRNNERERARRSNVPGVPARSRSISLVIKGAGFPGYKNKSGDMR